MPYLIIFLIAIFIVLLYIWLLGWLLFVIASAALGPLLLLALIASFVLAAVMPIILLTSSRWQEDRDRRLRTPDQVQAGAVLGRAPRGETAGWGWDHAWPTYFPYQAKATSASSRTGCGIDRVHSSLCRSSGLQLCGQSQPGL